MIQKEINETVNVIILKRKGKAKRIKGSESHDIGNYNIGERTWLDLSEIKDFLQNSRNKKKTIDKCRRWEGFVS